jgi:carbamoyl-phosphate synthase large subunit
MMNVLFTSVGRRVELLRAFRRGYEDLRLQGLIVAVDMDPLAAALQVADNSYIVPALSSPDYLPALVAICRKHCIDLVFPLIDPDIPVLTIGRGNIEATGARVAVLDAASVDTISDKWFTNKFFTSLGINTPQSWLPGRVRADEMEYPLFIKPRRGSAGKDAFKVTNDRDLRFFQEYVENPIIQQFIAGDEITNDIVADHNGNLLAIVSRRRIEVRSGEVTKGVTVYDQVITEACVEIAHALDVKCPITVQCIIKDGVPYFTEINARIGGGFPLGVAAGANSVQWLLAREAGLHVDIPTVGSYRTGLHLTRYDDSFFLAEGERDEVASANLRPRRHAVSGAKFCYEWIPSCRSVG